MVEEKIRILFVDDEPGVLDGLRRLFRKRREHWTCEFVLSGEDAIREFENQPFDVIVSDMRMPQMDGAMLLKEVSQRWPDTIRFVLSGQSERESIDRTLISTHQFLSKPCEAGELNERLDRAILLRNLCHHPDLRTMVSGLGTLPSVPDAYVKIREALRSEHCSLATIAKIVQSDMAMATKVLQLVNSAFYSVRAKVVEVERAVALLGIDIIQSLALTLGIFRQLQQDPRCADFPIERFWTHCMNCGALARKIVSETTGNKTEASTAMVAGLLHDIGILLRLSQRPEEFGKLHRETLSSKRLMYDVEMEQDRTSHAELGAYLLGLWGLPLTVIEAVLYHHHPEKLAERDFDAAAGVYVANILIQEQEVGSSGNGTVPVFAPELVSKWNLTTALEDLRKLVSQDRASGDAKKTGK